MNAKFAVSRVVALSLFVSCLPACALENNIAGAAEKPSPALNAQLDALTKQLDDRSGEPQKMLDQIAALLLAHPRSARAHFVAGRLYERAGFTELSQQEFVKADELDPSTPQAVLDLFLLKLQNDEFVGAWDRLGYLTARFPNDPAVAMMKALILQGSGRKDEAEKLLRSAMNNKQKRTGVATAIAQLKLTENKPAEAWQLVQEDLARDPNYFRANVVAGEALMRLGERDKAAAFLKKAYIADPLDLSFVNVYAANLYKGGLYAEALEPALIYLAQQTNHQKMTVAKLQVIALVRKLSNAQIKAGIAAADKRLDRTTWQGRLQLALGDIFDSLNERALAEQCYMRGIELLPDVGRAYYRLACDYEKDGQTLKALRLYQKAAEMEPGDQQVQMAFARFYMRAANRPNDMAWRLKDWMRAK